MFLLYTPWHHSIFSFFFFLIVSEGAQEIFKLLPHTFVDACKLPELVEEVFIVILFLFLTLFLIFSVFNNALWLRFSILRIASFSTLLVFFRVSIRFIKWSQNV